MYNLDNHNMCEFHLHAQGLWKIFKNPVNSIITFPRCLWVNIQFNYPGSLLVNVWLLLVPLSITGIGGESTVLEGDNLQLTCKVSSRLEPNVSWTKEKAGNQGNTRVVQEGKVLNVSNIDRTDAGTFTCRAYNGFGKPESQTVYVDVVCE